MTNDQVYEPILEDDSELCYPVKEDGFIEITDLLDGTPRKSSWKPMEMKLIHTVDGKEAHPRDAPWCGSDVLIFKPAVVLAMGNYLQEYGELLPLKCKNATLVMYNVTRVIDAIDEDASTFRRFSSGRIMSIEHHVFRNELIRDVDVFKLPLRGSSILLGQRFVDRWQSHGFTGLEFTPVK